MLYTFDDELTFDQKRAHLQEWIAIAERMLAMSAPNGSLPNSDLHDRHTEHLHMLRLWERLVDVEEELYATEDADPAGDPVLRTCRRLTRLQLRIGGVHSQLAAEKAKGDPSSMRVVRLQARLRELFRGLSIAREQAEPHVPALKVRGLFD